MPVVSTPFFATPSLVGSFIASNIFLITIKVTILLILLFYAIFALLIIKQVSVMVKTVITGISPLLMGIAIFNALFALVLIVLAAGVL